MAVMLGSYAAGLALIVAGAVAAGGERHILLIAGTATLALGATASFLIKAALVLGLAESRRAVWTNASAPMRAYMTFSLALWSLPALGFWFVTARQLGQ